MIRIDYNRYVVYPGGKIHLLDTFVYITIDPSGGASESTATSTTDKCGWCVGAVNVKDERFILELDEHHFNDEQFVDHVYKLHEKYLPRLIGIEKTPHLMSHFRRAEKEKKLVLPLTELKPRGRKKSVRITSARATLGYTYFLNSILMKSQLMLRSYYGEMQHGDDGVDAFAYFDDICVPPTEQQLLSHKQEILRLIEKNIVLHLPERDKREVVEVQRLLREHNQTYSADDDLEAFNNGE